MTKAKLEQSEHFRKARFEPITDYERLDGSLPQSAFYSADLDPRPAKYRDRDPALWIDTVDFWAAAQIKTIGLRGVHYDESETDEDKGRKTPIWYSGDKNKINTERDALALHNAGYPLATAGLMLDTLPHRFVAVDVDDKRHVDDALAWFGPPMFSIESARGLHLYYLNPDPDRIKSLPQSKSIAPIDLKASGMIVAPYAPYDVNGGLYRWTEKPDHMSKLDGLKAIIQMLATGRYADGTRGPYIAQQGLEHYFPDSHGQPITPTAKALTKAKPATLAKPANSPRKTIAAPTVEKPLKEGEGRNAHFQVQCCRIAAAYPITDKPPAAYLAECMAYSESGVYAVPLPDSEAKSCALKQWRQYHATGKNHFTKPYNGAGGKSAKRAAYVSDEIKTDMLDAITSRKAQHVLDARVIPVYEALQRFNLIGAHFTITRKFLSINSGLAFKSRKGLYAIKDVLIDAGLIERVPLHLTGHKTPYRYATADGKAGRAELFRFTDKAIADQHRAPHKAKTTERYDLDAFTKNIFKRNAGFDPTYSPEHAVRKQNERERRRRETLAILGAEILARE